MCVSIQVLHGHVLSAILSCKLYKELFSSQNRLCLYSRVIPINAPVASADAIVEGEPHCSRGVHVPDDVITQLPLELCHASVGQGEEGAPAKVDLAV